VPAVPQFRPRLEYGLDFLHDSLFEVGVS